MREELDYFTPAATVLSATHSMEGEEHAEPFYLFDPILPMPHRHFKCCTMLLLIRLFKRLSLIVLLVENVENRKILFTVTQ